MHNIPQHAPEEYWSELNEPREFQVQFPAWLPPFVDIRLQNLDKTVSTKHISGYFFQPKWAQKQEQYEDKSITTKTEIDSYFTEESSEKTIMKHTREKEFLHTTLATWLQNNTTKQKQEKLDNPVVNSTQWANACEIITTCKAMIFP